MNIALRIVAIALLWVLPGGGPIHLHAALNDPALRAVLQSASPREDLRVIVEFARPVDTAAFRHLPRPQRREVIAREMKSAADRDQRGVKSLLRSRGVGAGRSLWLINGLAIKAPAEVIRELAAHPEVQRLRVDRAHAKSDLLMQSLPPAEANINTINADNLWLQGNLGQGAVVAIMDTGADASHPDLAGAWRGGTNSWFDPFGQYASPHDPDGHGTAVLGLMVGGGAGGTSIGAAPGARWIAARMFDDSGFTYDSVIHQVFQWLLDPDGNPATDDLPDVVNASWGFENAPGVCDDTFQADIDALKSAGIAVVFAAGNTGPGGSTSISPGNNSGTIAVGFVDALNVIHPSSARGPSACNDGRIVYPDLVAPGVSLRTTDLSFGGFPFYASLSGTSASAPQVAGGLALLRSGFPDATLAQLESALMGQAAELGVPGPDNTYGNGLVDAAAASAALGAACVRPQVDFSAAPFPAAASQAITFSSIVSSGTPPYTYAWDFDGDNATDCTDAVCSHVYANAYSGPVTLTVAGADGCSSAIVVADGWAACTSITVGFTSNPAAPITGQAVTFTSNVSGGTAPYAYDWDVNGDGLTDCSTADCTTTYAAAYSGNVGLRVLDRFGCQAAVQSLPISVSAAAPQSSGGGGGGGCLLQTVANHDSIPNVIVGVVLVLALSVAILAKSQEIESIGRPLLRRLPEH
jgi:PKD repeat protein